MQDYLDINLAEVAYREIKELVSSGYYPAGTKVKPKEIIEKLQISNTPVMSALKRLVGEGFIEHRNRKGYFVKEYTEKELVEFLQLRAALESVALRIIIEKNEKEAIEELLNFWDGFIYENDYEYNLMDNRFHEKLVGLSGNDLIKDIWIKTRYNFKRNQNELQNVFEESWSDHQKILKCVEDRDPVNAQLYITEHFMRAARKRMING